MSPAFTDNDGRLDWRKLGYRARSAFAVLLSAAVLFGGGWFVYSKANEAYIAWRTAEDYIGEGHSEVQVLIESGSTSTQIGDLLTEAGVVKSTKAFREAAIESGKSDQLRAGRFRLKLELPAAAAFEALLNPDNLVKLEVVFPEGTTAAEQWKIVADKTTLSVKDMSVAGGQHGKIGLPDYAKGRIEGFLFPAKYQVAEPASATSILANQTKQFKVIAEKIGLEGRSAELGRTPRQVVTVASIIASEVSKTEDQPKVAAVIYNRLKAGMKLEMDSTVHYAVGKSGKVTTTDADRANKSPYNTYVHKGLPPGPISNPGESALNAALNPSNTKDKYFVTVNLETGETRFAETYEGHKANVALFQQWCSDNKDKGLC